MEANVSLPKAFSVRDDHELYPIQHLVVRLNPKFTATLVTTGRHVNGGGTVFWGIVYRQDRPPGKKEVEAALREAGFDFSHNVLVQGSVLAKNDSTDAAEVSH